MTKYLDWIWLYVPGGTFADKLTFLGFLIAVFTALPVIWWLYNFLKRNDVERTTRRVEKDIKEIKQMLRERNAETIGASGSSQQQLPSETTIGANLSANLDAGIKTLLKAGREAA